MTHKIKKFVKILILNKINIFKVKKKISNSSFMNLWIIIQPISKKYYS